ncbi:diacylglycerol kinase family protein [Patescibacteria group bacterium]|nr:diacylglycerol kinase family protein [Patescibacteria group bacterium]
MEIFNFKKLLNSLRIALFGLRTAFKEQTFRMMVAIATLTIFLAFYFKVTLIEKEILIFLIVLVLALELINTQIEKILNILSPNHDPKIKVIKDISAGAVLLACLGALIIGILIFLPYFSKPFSFFKR